MRKSCSQKNCKSDTFWNPKPLVITEIRNSSFFKLLIEDLKDSDGSDTERNLGFISQMEERTSEENNGRRFVK